MKEFLVSWNINIWADTHEDAAVMALNIQRDPSSLATIFNVVPRGPDGNGYDILAARRIDTSMDVEDTHVH